MYVFLIAFLVFLLWHGMGITIGYHRLLSHRTFRCPKFIEYFWVFGGLMAFEGSPIWWAAIHRAHHKFTDTHLDPHSPRFGIKNAWYGWTKHHRYPAHIDPYVHCKDLTKDPIYRLLDRGGSWDKARNATLALALGFRLVLLLFFGWQIAIASLLAGLLTLQIPLMLNVVCHLPRFGYKNYARNDDSVNVWWVGLLAMGEGWHNNHHAFPGSARTGLRWFEFDISWLTISFLRRLGLANHVNDAKALTRTTSNGSVIRPKETRRAA